VFGFSAIIAFYSIGQDIGFFLVFKGYHRFWHKPRILVSVFHAIFSMAQDFNL